MDEILNTLDLRRGIPMNRVATVIALTRVIFAWAPALVGDATSQSTRSKRQMIAQMVGCMRKRMSADRNRSYNDARKACQDQMNKQSDSLASGALVASDTPAKP